MKNTPYIKWYGLLLILSSTNYGCGGDKPSSLPELETMNISSMTQTAAESGGNIVSNGGSDITSKGVCWGTGNNPDLSGPFITEGSGDQPFVSILTGLTPDTEYTVKAYATNETGTSSGDPKTFRTMATGSTSQIIADHTIVDRYDEIPQQYIDEVKKMWLVYAGESHARAIRVGLQTS
ncbi:MAG: fibronectin type III domain-containing protein [Bacteroidales bacterium]|nr:fibronectin type III domain-containing protein [Bacteroidales bacterium]